MQPSVQVCVYDKQLFLFRNNRHKTVQPRDEQYFAVLMRSITLNVTVILEGRQVPLLISVINLNLSAKAEVKAEGRTEGGGRKGNCTPAAPLWCHSTVKRR